MRLFVGKNHQQNYPVQNLFRLMGNNEDALTYALGFLMAQDAQLCRKILRLCKVRMPASFQETYAVRLQEVTAPGYGRRDIAIEAGNMRVVLEAKIGRAEPTVDQLLKYADEERLWAQFNNRAVVALTQIPLTSAIYDEATRKLRRGRYRIKFSAVQWHQILDIVLQHTPSDDSQITHFLFEQFISFAIKDYAMGYFDAEVLVQNVNPLNAEIFQEGWMYVTALKDKRAPLYFAPYFTRRGGNSGITHIGKVLDTLTVTFAKEPDKRDFGSSIQQKHWEIGWERLWKRAHDEGFAGGDVRLFLLDEPIRFSHKPISKSSYNASNPPKKIPAMIPKGFSMGFDDLLKAASLTSPK